MVAGSFENFIPGSLASKRTWPKLSTAGSTAPYLCFPARSNPACQNHNIGLTRAVYSLLCQHFSPKSRLFFNSVLPLPPYHRILYLLYRQEWTLERVGIAFRMNYVSKSSYSSLDIYQSPHSIERNAVATGAPTMPSNAMLYRHVVRSRRKTADLSTKSFTGTTPSPSHLRRTALCYHLLERGSIYDA